MIVKSSIVALNANDSGIDKALYPCIKALQQK